MNTRSIARSVGSLVLLAGTLALCVALPADAARASRLARPVRVEPPRAETPAIINGHDVDAATYDTRWRAIVTIATGTTFVCGGTLVDPKTVVTAAHCMYDQNKALRTADSLRVIVGRRVLSDTSVGDSIQVSARFVHEGYVKTNQHNDIAVLQLAAAPTVPYATIEPLANSDELYRGLGPGWPMGNAAVGPWTAGWGVIDPATPKLQDVLREVQLPVRPDSECATTNAPGLGAWFDAATMICGGVAGNGTPAGGGIDACQGDSGGPLIVGDGAGTVRLVGITSWGDGCASPRYGAYTRVGVYTAWIDQYRSVVPVRPAPIDLTPKPPAGGTGTPPGGTPGGTPGDASTGTDTKAPSTPGGLRATSVTATSCTLRWSPSRDDVGVVGYDVQWYDGSAWRVFSRELGTTLTMRSMTSGSTYRFRIRAVDAAGNASAWATVTVHTRGDATPPSRPGVPRTIAHTRTSVTLAWPPSRDNVRVRGYLVWELTGARWHVVAHPRVPRLVVRGLRGGTVHRYQVQAVDAAGNRSRRSGMLLARAGA
jgi:secreted trypsin-like serine protease